MELSKIIYIIMIGIGAIITNKIIMKEKSNSKATLFYIALIAIILTLYAAINLIF